MASYGPTATLFTIARNHTVQQYDLNPNNLPSLVQNVQHVPGNLPPSPPNSLEEKDREDMSKQRDSAVSNHSAVSGASGATMPVFLDQGEESSENEDATLSPLQKIA
ncbi:hypothetical protein LTS18_015071, partial [Coniosporium uncinatum]